jgi:hypothetical protein
MFSKNIDSKCSSTNSLLDLFCLEASLFIFSNSRFESAMLTGVFVCEKDGHWALRRFTFDSYNEPIEPEIEVTTAAIEMGLGHEKKEF